MHILMVEDCPVMQQSVRDDFEGKHTVYFAKDGDDMIRLLDHVWVDMVIIDQTALYRGQSIEKLVRKVKRKRENIAVIIVTFGDDPPIGSADMVISSPSSTQLVALIEPARLYTQGRG